MPDHVKRSILRSRKLQHGNLKVKLITPLNKVSSGFNDCEAAIHKTRAILLVLKLRATAWGITSYNVLLCLFPFLFTVKVTISNSNASVEKNKNKETVLKNYKIKKNASEFGESSYKTCKKWMEKYVLG